jgi:hypothetical protein
LEAAAADCLRCSVSAGQRPALARRDFGRAAQLRDSGADQPAVAYEEIVKAHITRILSMLGLRDRVQAVVLADESGLIPPGSAA